MPPEEQATRFLVSLCITLKVLSNLADQMLEGELADEKLVVLLISTYLTQGNGSCYV